MGVGDGARGPDVGVGMVLDAGWDDAGEDVAPNSGATRSEIDTSRRAVTPSAARFNDNDDLLMVPPGHPVRQWTTYIAT